jgi:hypothetical protein
MRIGGVDTHGKPFDVQVMTHDASVSGFACHCQVSIPIGSAVDAWMNSSKKLAPGRARAVSVEKRDTAEQRYGFQFTQQPEQWILR